MTVIWHNPNCSTSRKVLAALRESGDDPEVIEYLKTPPDRETIRQWTADAGLTVRQALRQRNTPYHDLGLGDPELTDDQLLDSIVAHPILLERPFVRTPLGTRLCRPPERVFEIMANPPMPSAGDGGTPA